MATHMCLLFVLPDSLGVRFCCPQAVQGPAERGDQDLYPREHSKLRQGRTRERLRAFGAEPHACLNSPTCMSGLTSKLLTTQSPRRGVRRGPTHPRLPQPMPSHSTLTPLSARTVPLNTRR